MPWIWIAPAFGLGLAWAAPPLARQGSVAEHVRRLHRELPRAGSSDALARGAREGPGQRRDARVRRCTGVRRAVHLHRSRCGHVAATSLPAPVRDRGREAAHDRGRGRGGRGDLPDTVDRGALRDRGAVPAGSSSPGRDAGADRRRHVLPHVRAGARYRTRDPRVGSAVVPTRRPLWCARRRATVRGGGARLRAARRVVEGAAPTPAELGGLGDRRRLDGDPDGRVDLAVRRAAGAGPRLSVDPPRGEPGDGSGSHRRALPDPRRGVLRDDRRRRRRRGVHPARHAGSAARVASSAVSPMSRRPRCSRSSVPRRSSARGIACPSRRSCSSPSRLGGRASSCRA